MLFKLLLKEIIKVCLKDFYLIPAPVNKSSKDSLSETYRGIREDRDIMT